MFLVCDCVLDILRSALVTEALEIVSSFSEIMEVKAFPKTNTLGHYLLVLLVLSYLSYLIPLISRPVRD